MRKNYWYECLKSENPNSYTQEATQAGEMLWLWHKNRSQNAIDWMFESLRIHMLEILSPNVMVLRPEASGRWLVHEDGALRNGISDLIKKTAEGFLTPLPSEDRDKTAVYKAGSQFTIYQICLHLDPGLHALQNRKK